MKRLMFPLVAMVAVACQETADTVPIGTPNDTGAAEIAQLDTTGTGDAVAPTDPGAPKDPGPVSDPGTPPDGVVSDALTDADATPTKTLIVPDWFPGKDSAADDLVVIEGLEAPVRIVTDDRGTPHIYGKSAHDLAVAQGYVAARSRLFQMHTLRMAASGRLAELLGSGSLRGDIYLRTLKLRSTAEKMAELTKTKDPELYKLIEAFCAGANQVIAKVNAGTLPKPPEAVVFKLTFPDWTPTDTMTVVRLQTWELSFGGIWAEDDLLNAMTSLKAKFDGTPLEGIEKDALKFGPAVKVATLQKATKPGAAPVPSDTLDAVNFTYYQRFEPSWLASVSKNFAEMREIPHHLFAGAGDFGSNNWVVSGKHTASGRPILANDTHLSLRNPAIFARFHLSTVPAGGDYDVNGVNFSGAPGIVLGHNATASWGATVFYGDVTDLYVEDFDPVKRTVKHNGKDVPVIERTEVFEYTKPGEKACDSVVTDYIVNLSPKAEENPDPKLFKCKLTLTIMEVPHHGPVVPWSLGKDKEGKALMMSWQWPGFEPTTELSAVYRLNTMKSVDDFKAALEWFDVGSQNWIYADKAGTIAWYPSHKMPKRKHMTGGKVQYPPWLPMPGDGAQDWDGWVDRKDLPQSVNPDQGYLITANADPIGVSFDEDPLNDTPYIGYTWDIGFREARITQRIKAAIDGGKKLDPEMMAAIQNDHRSNVGNRLRPTLLEAFDALIATDPWPGTVALSKDAVKSLRQVVADWTLEAESGVDEPEASVKASDSIATSVFNAWLVALAKRAVGDELEPTNDRVRVMTLLQMIETPSAMVTYNPVSEQSRLWDDVSTKDVTETKKDVLRAALVEALAFLSDPAKVGPKVSGGFGTTDWKQWRWGALHTVTLKHNLPGGVNDVPSSQDPKYASGFPRPGDNYSVDASHPGVNNFLFTYAHGPAIRNVYEMTDAITYRGVIPGGQDENASSPHYRDEMDKWWKNEAPLVANTVAEVLAKKEFIRDLAPPSALK